MKKLLSIIVPTYNMEKYLHRCLDSLVLALDEMELFEVLVINDGSKDSSSDIAHEYEKRFPQTFRVIDKENGNYGSCINRGLKEALGKYVKVLDADDWFDNTAFGEYLDYLREIEVDMIISEYSIVNDKGDVLKINRFDFPSKRTLAVDNYCATNVFTSLQMHAITYKLEYLISNNYEQTTGVSYTDQEWIFLPVTYMKTFSYFDKSLYQYLVGREGQTVDPAIQARQIEIRLSLIKKRIDKYNKYMLNIGGPKGEYLRNKLLYSLSQLYVSGIIKKNFDICYIIKFDENLKLQSNSLYEELTQSTYGSYKGISYLNYWRKTLKLPIPLMIFSRIFNLIRRK